MALIAALPMYDWPEVRHETDAEWQKIRHALGERELDAPTSLARRNRDLPAVPGGITCEDGGHIAPDPATLPPDELDLHTLWCHPALLLAQTCWGPLQSGLLRHVKVIGQPDYSAFPGGDGIYYRSAILMRRRTGEIDAAVPKNADALFDPKELRGKRFVYNATDSMSGYMALRDDLGKAGLTGQTGFTAFWSQMIASGSHRQSVNNVAEGRADVTAVDCRTLDLCRRFEPALTELRIAGWTAQRLGLPYIAALRLCR